MDVEEDPKPQPSAEEILAAARAKRAAILAKHASAEASRAGTPSAEAGAASVAASGSGSVTNALNSPAARVALRNVTPQLEGDAASEKNGTVPASGSSLRGLIHRQTASIPGSPAAMTEDAALDLTQDAPSTANQASLHPLDDTTGAGGQTGHHSISAADYNPDDDRCLDDQRQLEKGRAGQQAGPLGATAKAEIEKPANGAAPRPAPEEDDDDDDDDMFAIGTKKAKKPRLDSGPAEAAQPFVPVRRVSFGSTSGGSSNSSGHRPWDCRDHQHSRRQL